MDISVDSGSELAHVLEQIVRVVRQLSTAGDLSLSAAATLARVSTNGPQRLTALAGWKRQSQPGMTQLVTRLERDGLVRRTSSPLDRRVVLVEVTAAGRDLVARRRLQRAAALTTLIEQLEPDDRDAVQRALPVLNRLADLALGPAGRTT